MSKKLKIVYYLKYTFKKAEEGIISSLNQDDEIELTIIPDTVDRKDLIDVLKRTEFDIFLHKNEHCHLNTCSYIKQVISFCYENNKMPCYFDYGYFGHYSSLIVDYYLPDYQSSIKKIFHTLPSNLDNLQDDVKQGLDRKYQIDPEESEKLEELGLLKNKFITIWAQSDVELLRENLLPRKEKNIINWFNKIIHEIKSKKLIPVIKTSPCEISYDINKIEGNPIIFVARDCQAKKFNLPFYKNINNFLNLNSYAHIVNCSSITNELIINNSKIAATGISWFNGFNIFHEPNNWNSLLDFPTENQENINKWINWWNLRQFPKDCISKKLKEISQEFLIKNLKLNFVSAYTINTPYEKEVENLKESLIKFGHSTKHIVSIDNLGTWEKNCQQKAIVIKNKLLELREPIIWLDADAVIEKPPTLFNEIQEDLGICVYRGEYLSGTIFLKPSKQIFDLLDEWIKECANNPKEWDQKILQKLILDKKINHFILPSSYCKVDFFKSDDNVISQNQASRRFKKIINQEKLDIKYPSFWTSGGIETVCGCGSMVKNMTNVIKQIPEIFKKFDINNVLEIGCGDLNFAKHCILNQNINYTGVDITRFKTWDNYPNLNLIKKIYKNSKK